MIKQIKNIEEYEKLINIQRKLNKVHQLDRLLKLLVDESVKLVAGEKGLCLIVDEKDKNLIAYYLDQNFHIKKRKKNRPDPIEQVTRLCLTIQTGKSYNVSDARKMEPFLFRTFFDDLIVSCLVFPIKRYGKTMGAIAITSSEVKKFSKTHERLMKLVCDFAAYSIRNSFRFKKEMILNRLKQSLIKALSLNELVEQINEAFEADGCSIFLKKDNKLMLEATTGILNVGKKHEMVYSIGEGLTGWIAKSRKPLRIYDTKDEEEVAQKAPGLQRKFPKWSEILGEEGDPEPYLGVPLKFRSEVTGVIRLSRVKAGRGFTAADESILTTLANFIAIKIENMKLLEEAKRESELRTRIIKHAPIGIACVNRDGTITEVNQAHINIMGGNATGQNIFELGTVPNDLKELIKEALKTGNPFEWGRREFTSLFGKKSFLSLRCEPLFKTANEVETLLILVEDVSRKLAVENQLIQIERVTSTQRIIGGVLHSFNSPIGSIKQSTANAKNFLRNLIELYMSFKTLRLAEEDEQFYLSLLADVFEKSSSEMHSFKEERKDRKRLGKFLSKHKISNAISVSRILAKVGITEKLRKIVYLLQNYDQEKLLNFLETVWEIGSNLKNCETSINQLSVSANSLREYSNIDVSRFEEVDVHDGLERVLNIFRNMINGRIKIKKAYSSGIPKIRAQIGTLNMVWHNLIENAIEAIKNEGNIYIETQRQNDRIIVKIGDDGPEIPREIRDKIFDIFFTTKGSNRPWAGYGLYFSKLVVERCGGKLTFTSNKKRTTFSVILPIGGDAK
ncbi:MAG: GAF domain-containing protein [bacterium]